MPPIRMGQRQPWRGITWLVVTALLCAQGESEDVVDPPPQQYVMVVAQGRSGECALYAMARICMAFHLARSYVRPAELESCRLPLPLTAYCQEMAEMV
jgi:hypothetical protein